MTQKLERKFIYLIVKNMLYFNFNIKRAFNIPDGVIFDLNSGNIYNNFYNDIPLSFADDYSVILENTKLLLYSG
jgi:hypothetical protein